MFAKEIYIQRREALKKQLPSGVGLFLGNAEAPCNYADNTYRYRQDSNFLYFFGLDLAPMAAVIDFDSGEEILFANEVSMDAIVWMGPQPSCQSLAERVGIQKVRPLGSLSDYLSQARGAGRKIHFTPPYRHDNMIRLMDMLGLHPSAQKAAASEDLIRAIVALRQVKKAEEIAELDKAADVGYEMHCAAMRHTRPGLLELEVAGVMEGVATGKAYMPSFPIILSQNGEIMHNHSHHQVLTEGRLVLVDAGIELPSHYCSDHTRTYPVSGRFTPFQKDIYNLVLQAQSTCIEMCAPDVLYKDVHLQAARIIAQGLKDLGFMQGDVEEAVAAGAHAAFFPTGLGHNMGLDVHDMEDLGEQYVGYQPGLIRSTQFGLKSLRMAKALQAGYVMTVEPGCYFIPQLLEMWRKEGRHTQFINYAKCAEQYHFGGIRIEDDVLITPTGHRLLGTRRIPVTVAEIEAFMAR